MEGLGVADQLPRPLPMQPGDHDHHTDLAEDQTDQDHRQDAKRFFTCAALSASSMALFASASAWV